MPFEGSEEQVFAFPLAKGIEPTEPPRWRQKGAQTSGNQGEFVVSKRETFAYTCEAYSCLIEAAASPAVTRALADQFARDCSIPDESVDATEVGSLIREAAAARNGWKVILARCSPTRGRQ